MALTIGELVGIIDLDDQQWDRGLRGASSEFDRFAGSIDRELVAMEQQFDRETREMFDAFERGAQRMDTELGQAFDDAADEARRGGQKIAQEVERGLDKGLDGTKATARKHGTSAGEEFGGGAGEGAEGKLSSAGKGLGGMLVKAGGWLAAGLAAGELLVDGLTKALDQGKANDKLAAQLGATPEMAKEFGGIAGRLYAQAYGESVSDVNDALREVWNSGLLNEDAATADIERITKKALDFAAVMDEEVSQSTRAAGQMIRNGLAKDADEAFDLMVRAFQQTGDKADDLLDTISEYSTKFRDLGLDGNKALGLLSQGLRAGARDADTVADAIKEFSIRAIDGSKSTKEGFDAIGLSADEMAKIFAKGGPEAADALDLVLDKLRGIEDPVARDAAAVALFGTKAEDLGDALYALDPSEAVYELGEVKDAAQKMGDTLADNAATKLEAFKRGLEQKLVNFIGGTVLPALENLVEGLSLTGVPERLEEVYLKVKTFFLKIVQDVKIWAAQHQEQIQGVIDRTKQAFDNIVSAVGSFVDAAQRWWDLFGENFLGTLVNTIENGLQIISGFFEMVGGLFEMVVGILTGDWQRAWDGLNKITDGGTQQVAGLVDLFLGNLLSSMGVDYDAMKAKARDLWDQTVRAAENGISWVLDKVDGLSELGPKAGHWFGELRNAAVAKAGELVDWVRGLPNMIISAIGDLGGLLWSAGARLISGFIDGVKAKFNEVKQTLSNLTSMLPSWKGPPDVDAKLLTENGRLIMQSLIDGFAKGEHGVEAYLSALTGRLGRAVGGLDAASGLPAVAPAVLAASAPSTGSGTGADGRALVSIGTFYAQPWQSPGQIADELHWKSKGGG